VERSAVVQKALLMATRNKLHLLEASLPPSQKKKNLTDQQQRAGGRKSISQPFLGTTF
jgi:hypothetical protein